MESKSVGFLGLKFKDKNTPFQNAIFPNRIFDFIFNLHFGPLLDLSKSISNHGRALSPYFSSRVGFSELKMDSKWPKSSIEKKKVTDHQPITR